MLHPGQRKPRRAFAIAGKTDLSYHKTSAPPSRLSRGHSPYTDSETGVHVSEYQPHLPPPSFLTLSKAAQYLGISANTLYVWRHRRQGPPSFRMGGRVMYRISALEEWVAAQESADSRSNPSRSPFSRPPQRRTPRWNR
ncbi:DNA-binding protein [Streptomyces diacarni]|uniref:DNA-binding protein n=1 Tax=Streptomyces diacarni TaxID=2800381 RepID=A0A367F2C1_9ACTN|nr:helix-turn-helix domain-containing protein [Streptomyces diacarni]RCG24099.1 DNA-binding protein [Streptomyces diacarni]